jgi:hypothetical protein
MRGRHARHVSTAAGALAALALLAGCGGSQPDGPVWGAADGVYLTERWCYETLAEIDCYTTPQPHADERRVGWFDVIPVE